jgi:hypothetical protein
MGRPRVAQGRDPYPWQARRLAHPAGGYNSPMRALLFCLVLTLAMSHTAFAAAASSARGTGAAGVATACAASARDCCHRISVTCIELKYRPLCDYPPHRCPTPYTPCPEVACVAPPCHLPPVTCYPEAPCIDVQPVCHKPAVVVIPEDPCEE